MHTGSQTWTRFVPCMVAGKRRGIIIRKPAVRPWPFKSEESLKLFPHPDPGPAAITFQLIRLLSFSGRLLINKTSCCFPTLLVLWGKRKFGAVVQPDLVTREITKERLLVLRYQSISLSYVKRESRSFRNE